MGDLGETLGVDLVRRRPAQLPVADDPQANDGVVDQRRLVDDGAGEARDSGALGVDEGLGLVTLGRAQCVLGEIECPAQAETPTSTSRKRAGAAPCETCASWPGCPLPQFVRPKSCQASGPATASSLPQKTGVLPV